MTSIILNYFVYLYTFLEIYVFVYSQELRIRSHYEYFEHLAQLNCTEIEVVTSLLSQPEPISNVIEMEPPVQVIFSDLDVAAEGLFAELQQELGISESMVKEPVLTNKSEFDFFHESWMDDSISLSDYQEEEDVYEDCNHLSVLKDEEEKQKTGYEAFASSKIADSIDGPQQWVVSVVGMEESYIHVSD